MLALPILLLAAVAAVPPAAPPVPPLTGLAQFGPWSMRCHREGEMGGHAFETCKAIATLGPADVSIERDARGLTGFIAGRSCKAFGKGVFLLNAKTLADPRKRAARFVKTIDQVLAQCGQPAAGLDPGVTETLLQASDGLSPEWKGLSPG